MIYWGVKTKGALIDRSTEYFPLGAVLKSPPCFKSPYRRHHFLRQVSIVELRDPVCRHSVQDVRQILPGHEEARERRTAIRKEEISESLRDVFQLDMGQSVRYREQTVIARGFESEP